MSDLIDDIILRETGGKPNGGFTDDPADAGGRTIWGISEKGNPDLWKDGPPTYEQARRRYFERYVAPFHGVTDLSLLNQLVDWGVTSGPQVVIRTLQQLVGVGIDGKLGPQTLKKIDNHPGGMLFGYQAPGSVMLNLAVRDARAIHYASITKARPTNLRFILGWLSRTFQFK